MGSGDGAAQMNLLERGLLSKPGSHDEDTGAEDETVLYTASFKEMEDNFVKYQTAQWVLYSLLLILAWGIGLFMLLYLPVRRHILRKDIRSRRLYVTPNAIVYKVNLQALQVSSFSFSKLCVVFTKLFCVCPFSIITCLIGEGWV